MKLFWPVYLFSLAVGTAAVYVAAPYARPSVRDLFPPEAPAPGPEAGAEPARPALRQPPPPAAAAVGSRGDEELPPALCGVYPAAGNEEPGWGITCQQTAYYSPGGSRLGTLPGGVLFVCGQRSAPSGGPMIACSLVREGGNEGPYLLGRSSVELFTAAHTNLSARQLGALRDYYALKGKIARRRSDLLAASAAGNPHFAEARETYRAYQTHLEQARALAARREQAADSEKTRLEDRLREMKMEEGRLRAATEAANQKFSAWKTRHGGAGTPPEQDPDIARWTRELEPLRAAMPGLAR